MSNKSIWQNLINHCKKNNMDYRRMKDIITGIAEKYYLKGRYDTIDQAIEHIIELIINGKKLGR
jgi:hypothetical protein